MSARPAAADNSRESRCPQRPAVAENTFAYCLFARISGSTIVWGSASFSTDFILLQFPAAQFLMFPFVLGEIHLSTDFRLPL